LLLSRSHTRNQLQPRALSDSKAENQVSKQHEDYETHNITTRSLSDPAAPLSEELNSRIRLIGNRFKYPLFILHLIHKHEIDTMDAFKRSYESVFNSLSDTQSSGLLGTWLHSLSDASDYQCNPFWWPSQIDFNKDQEQKPEGMLCSYKEWINPRLIFYRYEEDIAAYGLRKSWFFVSRRPEKTPSLSSQRGKSFWFMAVY